MDNGYVSEELDEWQLIRSLSNSSFNAHWISENEPPVINDDFFSECAVFTPVYHQGLSMYTSLEGQLQSSSSEQTIYSRLNDEDENESSTIKGDEDGVENEDGKERGVLVDEWKSRLVMFVSKAKSDNWWFSGFVMTGVMSTLVASLWCMKVGKWRKRVHKERVEQLMLLIREKDQKINQLLLQIAHMNEAISARRTVPVIRLA